MTTDNDPLLSDKAKAVVAETRAFVDLINEDLQIFTPSNLDAIVPKWAVMAAISGGYPLNPALEEDIKQTMEKNWTPFSGFGEGLRAGIKSDVSFSEITMLTTDNHTFLVILPGNDRRHIQAAYMEVDGGSLYFEDDNRETILAFGPGHWVWAERVERSEKEEVYRDLRDYEPTKLSKMDDAGLWESTDNGETWKLVITARDSQNPT